MRRALMMLALSVPLFSAACGADADGDGVKASEDCNDNDPDISPEATEICDGRDNNCDGQTDEGVLETFYVDQDRDGFGDPDSPQEACEAGLGLADNDEDCDDNEDAAYPGNDEVCGDGIDNDCSGEADDDGAVDASTWYQDSDGDLFGSDETTIVSCDPGDGWAPDGGDCNDEDPDVNPGADEVCGDGIDNDCANGPDDGDAIDAQLWHHDADSDSFGDPDDSQRACTQPDGYILDGTDCDDSDRDENPSVTWYPDGDGDDYGPDVEGQECERAAETDAPQSGDCDDMDPDINPGAEEIWYDEVDQDCSGGSDFDQDGDGYESTVEADGEDCDDTDAGINPLQMEIFDGVDNNCDSLCDEGFINRGDLIITEVMNNPQQTDDLDGEYFEIYNDTSSDIVMCGGWSIEDADADSHEITGGPITIPANDWFVFGINSDTGTNGGVTVDYEYSGFSLGNSDDEIVIYFDGATIDKIGYDDGATFPDPNGASMSLDPDYRDEVDNDDGANWCDSPADSSGVLGSGDFGTPGAANLECPSGS